MSNLTCWTKYNVTVHILEANIPFLAEFIDSSGSRRPPCSMHLAIVDIVDSRYHNSIPRDVSFGSYDFPWQLALTAVLLFIAPFIHFLAGMDCTRTHLTRFFSRLCTT